MATDGAGIYLESGSLELTNTTIEFNRAAERGGGLFIAGGSATLTEVTIANNVAEDGVATEFGVSGVGGGVYVGESATLSMNQSTITGHTGPQGAAIFNVGDVSISHSSIIDNGGVGAIAGAQPWGVVFNRGDLTVEDSTFDGNPSGALVNATNAHAHFARTTISFPQEVRNPNSSTAIIATSVGVFNDNGNVEFYDTHFTGYFGAWAGGAIVNNDLDAELTVVNSTFQANGSKIGGGAVWNQSGSASIVNSTFVENWVFDDGGAPSLPGDPIGGGAISHLGEHRFLGVTDAQVLELAAAVNWHQDEIYVVDTSPLDGLALPLGILIGDEPMQVIEVDEFRGALKVERLQCSLHPVTATIETQIAPDQTYISLLAPETLSRYSLPLDILIDAEVMTITSIEDDLARVERGRRGTTPAFHKKPAEVWGLAGGLEIASSTLTLNAVDQQIVSGLAGGGAIRSVVQPLAPPTMIESVTMHGNQTHVGAAIFTDRERLRVRQQDDPIAEGQWWNPHAFSLTDDSGTTFPAEAYADGESSLIIQNSAILGSRRPSDGLPWAPVAGAFIFDSDMITDGFYEILPPDDLASAGGNFVDADMFMHTRLSEPLFASMSRVDVFIPAPGFPDAPFKARLAKPVGDETVYENVLVTDVKVDESRRSAMLTMERGHGDTEPLNFPGGTQLTVSLSGFTHPTDYVGACWNTEAD